MIILSYCYIYTNTILYTVEIYNPVCPISGTLNQHPSSLTPTIRSMIHSQKIPVQNNSVRGWRHQANITSYELLNTPSTPHPRQKLIRHLNPTSVQPSFSIFLKTILTQFSFIIVSLSRQQQHPARVKRMTGMRRGRKDRLLRQGELPRLSCSAECEKAQVWITAVLAGMTPCCGLLWCVHGSLLLTERGCSFFSWFSVKHLAPPSVSGLVKEDVAWLRVLGDFRSETVEFFYGLCIDFLQEQKDDIR